MKFANTHEWLKLDGDVAVMGISNHAQEQLSDVVFVDFPEVGDVISKSESFMAIESVKAASDIYAPADGEIVELNTALDDNPELVNTSAETDGWLVKIKLSDKAEYESLMSAEDYQASLS